MAASTGHVLPAVLATSQRGVCPTCGVPLPLAASRQVTCSYCGGVAGLSIRLRSVEPDLRQPQERSPQWTPRVGRYTECRCGGCGSAIEASTEVSHVECPCCGGRSRVECRLLPITPEHVDPPQEKTLADLKTRDRKVYPWDIETEQLIWRILHEEHSQRVDNLTRQLVAPGLSDTERSRITRELTEAVTTLQQKITRLIGGG